MGYFISKNYFEEDGTQNYLVFQPITKHFKVIGNTLSISLWQSKGLSAETINPPTTILYLLIDCVGNKVRLEFGGSCLKESNKLTYTHKTIDHIYIVYELGASNSHNNGPTLKNRLFDAVTLTQILINMGIMIVELDLLEDQAFHFLVVDLVKMY